MIEALEITTGYPRGREPIATFGGIGGRIDLISSPDGDIHLE